MIHISSLFSLPSWSLYLLYHFCFLFPLTIPRYSMYGQHYSMVCFHKLNFLDSTCNREKSWSAFLCLYYFIYHYVSQIHLCYWPQQKCLRFLRLDTIWLSICIISLSSSRSKLTLTLCRQCYSEHGRIDILQCIYSLWIWNQRVYYE